MRGLHLIDGSPLKLVRSKENTYTWIKEGKQLIERLTRPEAIAYGYWHYQVPRSEADKALNILKGRDHTVAIFSQRGKYLYTY